MQCSGRAGEKVHASSHDIVVLQARKCRNVNAGSGGYADPLYGYAVVTDEAVYP